MWILHVDGSSNIRGSVVGICLQSPSGEVIEQSFRLGFKASNNEAEYEAVVAGLRLAKALGVKQLKVLSDSQLVVNQVLGDYAARDSKMVAYLELISMLRAEFDSCTF